jgi:S1-C subfamily serine protease
MCICVCMHAWMDDTELRRWRVLAALDPSKKVLPSNPLPACLAHAGAAGPSAIALTRTRAHSCLLALFQLIYLMVPYVCPGIERAIPWGAIVQFTVSGASINLKNPWKTDPTKKWTGSGFFIGDRRILTNNHVVQSATSIRIGTVECVCIN